MIMIIIVIMCINIIIINENIINVMIMTNVWK